MRIRGKYYLIGLFSICFLLQNCTEKEKEDVPTVVKGKVQDVYNGVPLKDFTFTIVECDDCELNGRCHSFMELKTDSLGNFYKNFTGKDCESYYFVTPYTKLYGHNYSYYVGQSYQAGGYGGISVGKENTFLFSLKPWKVMEINVLNIVEIKEGEKLRINFRDDILYEIYSWKNFQNYQYPYYIDSVPYYYHVLPEETIHVYWSYFLKGNENETNGDTYLYTGKSLDTLKFTINVKDTVL